MSSCRVRVRSAIEHDKPHPTWSAGNRRHHVAQDPPALSPPRPRAERVRWRRHIPYTRAGTRAPTATSAACRAGHPRGHRKRVSDQGGDGTLRSEFFNTLTEVATAPIAADGSFSLQLPAEVPASSLADSTSYRFCEEGAVNISPSSWSVDNFSVLEVAQGGSVTGELLLSNVSALAGSDSLEGLKNVDFGTRACR